MAHLIRVDDEFVRCDECDMIFSVVFNRNPIYDCVQYCPFCGAENEGLIEETADAE